MVEQPNIILQPEPIVAEVIIPELDVNEETDINNLNGPPAPANANREENKKESAEIQRTRIEDYEVLLPMTRITLAKWTELIGEEISV